MDLDALIAEVGADAVARFRRPSMDRAAAERALAELRARLPAQPGPPEAPRAPRAARSERPYPPLPAPPSVSGPSGSGGDGSDRVRSLRAAARRVTGGQRPVQPRAARDRDTVDHEPDPFLDQDRRVMRHGAPSAPRSALLRPPSRPLPRVSPPTPAPEPASPTRAAMGALFDDDSNNGLVLFGEGSDAPDGFGPQAGTDPAIAPLPEDGPEGPSERTMDDLGRPLSGGAPVEGASGEPQLAGAEEPMPMDVPAAPFGFGPGDAEPTRVDRNPAERHAPGHLSEAVVVSSVRKLFRR